MRAVATLVIVATLMIAHAIQAQPVVQPLCVMNIDGTEMREVAAIPTRGWCGSPSWSDNGEFIAFDAHGPNFSDQHAYVVELATGAITDLGPGGVPSVSPDSERIAFHRGRSIWIVNRDGSNARKFFDSASHPCWSADGKLIAYRTPAGDNLGIYDVESGERRNLFDEPTSTLSWGRAWSPDGRQIALRRSGRGASEELVLLSAESSSRGMRVRYRGDLSSHANWSRDGSRILIGIYLPGDGPRHLHYLSPKGRAKPTPIPGQDMDYSYGDGTFSPDGEQVAFGWRRHVPDKAPEQP